MINSKKNNNQHSKSATTLKRDQKNSQVIQKQLNDDFQVYQYLNQNKLQGNNIEEYLKLHDSLLVAKSSKKKSLDNLGCHYRKLKAINEADANLQVTSDQDLQILKQNFQIEYDKTQRQTMNELEIKKNLWKQIIESKKSLSLLKGDIGHLVGRNQSAKLLQSKITKVKIVADDQIKRVSMAFGKDKQQIKIRNEMQKIFHNKLKNISFVQQKNLENLKRGYIESVQKKKNLFERLIEIEKISASIDQYDDLERQKNFKNYKSIQMFKSLQNIYNLIKSKPLKQIIQFKTQEESNRVNKSNQLTNKTFENIRNYVNGLQNQFELFNEKTIYDNDKTRNITFQNLYTIQKQIIKQYFQIKFQMTKTCKLYQQKIKNVKQLWKELQSNDQLQGQDEGQSNKRWSSFACHQQRLTYIQKIKIFGNNIKTIIKFLVFIHKKQSKIFDQKNQNEKDKKIYSTHLLFLYRYLFDIDIKNISQLQQQSKEIQKKSQQIFKNLNNDIQNWNKSFYSIVKSEKFKLFLKNSKQKMQRVQKRKKTALILSLQTQQQKQIQDDSGNPDVKSLQRKKLDVNALQNQDTQYDQDISNFSVQRTAIQSIKSQKQKPKQLISSYYCGQIKDCGVKAQRIKLLEDIDRNYYKMLKNTLKMQKQNTRKNYEFLRSFKRAKYANRDEILDQKRFQSSFSVLLTNNDAKPKISPKKSVYYESKKQTSRIKPHTTSSSFFNKRSTKSIRIKQGKLQKVKLTQKLRSILNEI